MFHIKLTQEVLTFYCKNSLTVYNATVHFHYKHKKTVSLMNNVSAVPSMSTGKTDKNAWVKLKLFDQIVLSLRREYVRKLYGFD